jgi:hypothetical protein
VTLIAGIFAAVRSSRRCPSEEYAVGMIGGRQLRAPKKLNRHKHSGGANSSRRPLPEAQPALVVSALDEAALAGEHHRLDTVAEPRFAESARRAVFTA